MRKTWFNQFTPEILSVFGKPTATNNGARSLHKQLKEDITKHRPKVWVFVLKLSNILKDNENQVINLQKQFKSSKKPPTDPGCDDMK